MARRGTRRIWGKVVPFRRRRPRPGCRTGLSGCHGGGERATIRGMTRPAALVPVYDGWADQHRRIIETLSPLTDEQVKLRLGEEWAIWQLAGNMIGGRLYWLCSMLSEDDLGCRARLFGSNPEGWEDNPERPRSAAELVDGFEQTWGVVEKALDRWTLEDLARPVEAIDFWGRPRTITPSFVVWRLSSHEAHHGSEIAATLRVHGLPTAIAG